MFDRPMLNRLLLLATGVWWFAASAAQTPAAQFYFEAKIDGQPVRYQVPGHMHAAVCCNDRMEVQSHAGAADTIVTLRVESASLYKNNYLAGEGITLLLVSKEKNGKPADKAAWEARVMSVGEKNLALRNQYAKIDEYIRGGVELRWKNAQGVTYSSALGKEKFANFSITEVRKEPGKAIGGFGNYQYVITAQFRCRLYAKDAKPVTIEDGKLVIGIFDNAIKQ
jgi:ribonuclease HI